MNCDKCCGCVPPITTYNPSVADNFPTILQQVEYLKAMLKKYPSQQWFITQEKVTEDTIKLDRTKVSLRGRDIAEGDFILGNKEDGTTLMFQYTGVIIELRNYVVEFVGIYSNQSLAEQALSLAQTNEQDIAKLDSEIIDKVDKIEKGAKQRLYTKEISGLDSFVESDRTASGDTIVRRFTDSSIQAEVGSSLKSVTNREFFSNYKNEVYLSGVYSSFYYSKVGNRVFEILFSLNGVENNAFSVVSKKELNEILANQQFKTLFGNQSITGEGNIDLYRHLIIFSSETYGNISVVYYSSKNLKVDSLTDLKTLMGEAIGYPASGAVGSEAFEIVKTIDLANLNVSYGANKTMSLSNFSIQDYITTI